MGPLLHSPFFVAVTILAGTGAALLCVRWRRNVHDDWAPRRPMPKVSFGLLGAVVVATGVITWQHNQLEDQLSRKASKLAGFRVKVECQNVAGAAIDISGDAGSVKFGADGVPQHTTLIRHEQCGELRSYLDHHGRHPTADQVIAVHVLTHETMHMRGIANEAGAECAAVQRDAQMAQLLGASATDARALAVQYWNDDYPQMPDDYRSGECHPGGQLDERLPAGWPTTPIQW